MDADRQTTRPNVLVLMADQLRHDWLGVAGTPGVVTPHIDGLAAQGTRFTNACTNSAICAPARISLASGRSPERLGALGNEATLAADVPTHYQHLRDHDYRVGVVGKLDLAKSAMDNGPRGDRPATFRWGFTHPVEAEGKMHAGGGAAGRPRGPYGHWLQERGMFDAFAADYERRLSHHRDAGRPGPDGRPLARYADDDLYRDSVLPADAVEDRWIGRRAVRWIEDVALDHPWYLFVSFVGPHDPFDPPAAWADRFRQAPVPAPIPVGGPGRPSHATPAVWDLTPTEVIAARRQYTAATALIDAEMGAILAALDARGLREVTHVIVTSDHGEMLGDHGLFQKSIAYESAMRIPLIVAGPGVAVGTDDALIELADLGPTVSELAGLPAQDRLDACSFAGLLTGHGQTPRRRVTVCSEHHYVAIRSATAKYIYNSRADRLDGPDEPEEVYDLCADPGEQHNLVVEDPERAALLRTELIDAALADGQPLRRPALA